MDCLPQPQAGAVRGTAIVISFKVMRCIIKAWSRRPTPTIEAPLEPTYYKPMDSPAIGISKARAGKSLLFFATR
jgi:hypothetical protein